MTRERDDLGKFTESSSKREYGGMQVCKKCGEEKECTHKNFRINTKGGNRVSSICRACQYKDQKEKHLASTNDIEYLKKRRERGKRYRESNRDKVLFNNYSRLDKIKGRVSDLTLEDVRRIIQSPCIYCGDKGDVGLDRIDNSIGHSVENILPCCSVCNKARSDFFSVEEMMTIIGPAIREVRNRRCNGKWTGLGGVSQRWQ